MRAVPAMHVIQDPNRAAAALHPLRLRILAELEEPDSAAGLARRLRMPRQQLNYHVRQLEAEGLLEAVGERKKRNCTERLVRAAASSYVISPATLGRLGADPDRIRDHASSAYLVAVAARLIGEVAVQRDRAERAGKKLPTLTLQANVRFPSQQAQHAFAEELSREVARLVAKYHDGDTPRGRPFRFVAGAYPTPSDADNASTSQEDAS